MKKAQDIEGIYDVFEHDRALTPEDVDDFYVDIYKEEVNNFVTDLRFNKDKSKIFLIAGQSGNGKSSVLNTLTTKYKKIEENYEFHFISGKRIFIYDDIDIIDILLMIGNVLSRTSTKLSNAYKKKLQDLEDVKDGTLQESEQNINKQNNTLEANAKISLGANFFSFLKANASFEDGYKINEEVRQDARRFFTIKRMELVKLINEIISDYKQENNTNKKLVVIIDDLEKKDNVDNLFLKDLSILNEINIVKIITMPIHLKRNNHFGTAIVREFGLKLFDFHDNRQKNDNIVLQEIVRKRLDTSKNLIEDGVIDKAIEYSGANIRQLIKLIHLSALKALSFDDIDIVNKIGDDEITHAIKRLQLDMSSMVMNQITFLNEINTKKRHNNDSEEYLKSIAYCSKNELVFAYFNGVVWYGINPLAKEPLRIYSQNN
jgi:ABC-type branched-subunit amino acid transport system ATPase component